MKSEFKTWKIGETTCWAMRRNPPDMSGATHYAKVHRKINDEHWDIEKKTWSIVDAIAAAEQLAEKLNKISTIYFV